MAEDLRDVFRTGDPHYTPEQGWEAWQAFCGKWEKITAASRDSFTGIISPV